MKHYFIDFEIDNEVYSCEHMIVQPNDWLRDKYDGYSLDFSLKIVLPDAPGSLTEYLDNSQVLLIIREDLVSIFEQIEEQSFQKHEVQLRRDTEFKYYYIHTLNNLRAVDLNRSEVVQKIPGIPVYSEIKNLTLIESKVKHRDIFRLEEIKPKLIVSERIKDKIEKEEKFKQILFTECNGFNWK